MVEQTGPTDPKELEAFVDAFFAEHMEKLHIPGAVFVLVKEGEIFFAKGYGYSNVEKKDPVIPERTIFHMGSISKLFTATAVMQLYERGELNLNDNVNKYLNHLQLEGNYEKPVTLANLLTHTSGLEQRGIGTAVRNESEFVPLEEYLASETLRRVMPPEEVIIYSSPGVALAGHLVEQISGVTYAEYIEENIFQPLGMSRSSFEQPPPSRLASDLAIGYRYEKGTYKPYKSGYLSVFPPAGDFYSTAIDIAHFMIAHLQNGRYRNSRVLGEATAQDMHLQHFTNHPRLRGRAYGFSEWFENDQRAIFHDGSAPGFNARLFLMPGQNMGFFVAWNSSAERARPLKLHWELTSQFLDRYYPVEEKPVAVKQLFGFQHKADCFTGSYGSYEFSSKTFAKISALFGQIRVKENDDGTLSVGSSRYVQVEPMFFQQTDGDSYVAFKEDDNGNINHLLLGTGALRKLLWYETARFQFGLIGFFALVFLSACIVNLLPLIGLGFSYMSQLPQLMAGIIGALNLIFLAGLTASILKIDWWEFAYGTPPVLIALLVMPLVTTILTVGLPIFAAIAWADTYWSGIGRLHYLLITVGTFTYILFLHYWNLLKLKTFW